MSDNPGFIKKFKNMSKYIVLVDYDDSDGIDEVLKETVGAFYSQNSKTWIVTKEAYSALERKPNPLRDHYDEKDLQTEYTFKDFIELALGGQKASVPLLPGMEVEVDIWEYVNWFNESTDEWIKSADDWFEYFMQNVVRNCLKDIKKQINSWEVEWKAAGSPIEQ